MIELPPDHCLFEYVVVIGSVVFKTTKNLQSDDFPFEFPSPYVGKSTTSCGIPANPFDIMLEEVPRERSFVIDYLLQSSFHKPVGWECLFLVNKLCRCQPGVINRE